LKEALAAAIIEIDDVIFLDKCVLLLDSKSRQAWDSLVEDAVAITEEYPYRWGSVKE